MTHKLRNAVIERLDLQAHSGDLPSPCISVCQMNRHTGWCEGCLRTIDEIVEWSGAHEQRKRAIWADVKRRYAKTVEDAT
jgi:predicted Fe-S protein YdhL (DUF1289 family)